MEKTAQVLPAFEVALSEEQLEDLGRFTAIFSQIDFMMVQILAFASNITAQNLLALIEGTTAGQHLGMLRRVARKMPDPQLREKAESIYSGLIGLNDKRNHILHGVWGLQWDTENDTLTPACAHERNRENPIFAEQLPELCERAAKLSHQVMELAGILNSAIFNATQEGGVPRRFLMAKGPPPNRPAPEWRPSSRRSFSRDRPTQPTEPADQK